MDDTAAEVDRAQVDHLGAEPVGFGHIEDLDPNTDIADMMFSTFRLQLGR